MQHLNPFFMVLRLCIGAFFLYVGIRKLFAIDALIDDIPLFQVLPQAWLDLPVPEAIAYFAVALEITCGLLLILKRWLYGGALAMLMVMCTVFVGLYVQGWWRGLTLACNCLGSKSQVTNYAWEIGWRAGLLILVVLLFWDMLAVSRKIFPVRRLKQAEF